MIQRLTREQRRIKRIMDKLEKKAIKDEHEAVAFYRNRAKEFRNAGYYEEAEIMDTISKHEQIHKDIINEMLLDLQRKVIWKKYLEEKGD